MSENFSVVALFAGIGGIERGLELAGGLPVLACENWEPAQRVLNAHFPDVPLHGDIRDLRSLPRVDVVTAGFPCTDLSQAGRTIGIGGKQSGLVNEVFRLIGRRRVPTLLLENVRNMLVLDGGRAMSFLVSELENLGYRWAYRVVDSRCVGVPQRRQRVIMIASRKLDPRSILFADETDALSEPAYSKDLFGFYWTEGLRGLGWAQDAVPTLKGGSTVGIPSPPAIWHPEGELGRQIFLPTIEDAEELQGLPRGWTSPAELVSKKKGTRWKLVGNAVTVGVAEWIGSRIRDPGIPLNRGSALETGSSWPSAAYGWKGGVWRVDASFWPVCVEYKHLRKVVDPHRSQPLSVKASTGFLSRAERSTLRFTPGFLDDLRHHVEVLKGSREVA